MRFVFLFFVFILLNTELLSQISSENLTTGPTSGTLIAIGGNASDDVFFPYLRDEAGGLSAKIVIIPTARSEESISHDPNFNALKERFSAFGFTNVSVLHTRDQNKANDPNFVKTLSEADGVWIQGGRQWRLVDAYMNTLVHLELIGVLHRGGVIAGTSAGATIQGSFLVRGDTKTNTIMVGDHLDGFSFIKNIAIDQHVLARNRHFDMFEVLAEYPNLLGIGLDENTGIVVKNNQFEVIGNSYVLVYDKSRWSEERDNLLKWENNKKEFYFLGSGMKYDLSKRMIIPEE